MNYKEIANKLKQIKIEDYIWVIYIGIIILSWYSNDLEKIYYLYNNQEAKNKYHNTLILIFFILLIVYIYFFKSSLDDVNNLKDTDSYEKKQLVFLSFLGSLFILISGLIFLYVAIKDNNLDVELAFN